MSRIEALGAIGRTEGGITRLAFSKEDREARELLIRWMNDLELSVHVDAAGNIFGTWGDATIPPILLGSHIDSVPDGGMYDGCLGVVAALEVVAACRREGISPRIPLQVVAFQMEESSRFGQAMFGSRVFAGRLTAAEVSGWRDHNGQTLADCLAESGTDLIRLDTARHLRPPRAYLELHIEQGTMLTGAGAAVGIVTGIAAPLRIRLMVIGEAAHSGAALPEQRKDALMAAARILGRVEDLVERERSWGTVATVGFFRVHPNVMNVVPGEVEMGVDVRGVNAGSRQRLARAILQVAASVSAERKLEVSASVVGEEYPVVLDDALTTLLESAARDEGVSYQRVISLAGHDAMQMATIAPAGMVLVRNVSGTSHSPKEWVAPDDIEAGCEVFYRAIRTLIRAIPET
ncbi:MAG TPA: M20 family metallo-hydrolase [bacterium]|nr:M20 family metallo-hydrolase [bacterium]